MIRSGAVPVCKDRTKVERRPGILPASSIPARQGRPGNHRTGGTEHVAQQQLDTAIRLLFENVDHLSAYTLAAASREITDDLCDKQPNQLFQDEYARLGDPLEVRLSFRDEIRMFIKAEHFDDAMRLFRKRQNFLKHADRDAEAEIDGVSIDELAVVILFSIKNFHLLAKRVTPAMSLFLMWYGAANPRTVKSGTSSHSGVFRAIQGLREMYDDLYADAVLEIMYEHLKQQSGCAGI